MSGAVKAIGSIFKKPKEPKPVAPIPLPDPEDPVAKLKAVQEARRRSKSGRAGTIYSGTTGGAFGGNNLAGTA